MNPIRSNSGVVKEPINPTAQLLMCDSGKKEVRAGDMAAEQRCVMDHAAVQLKSSTAGGKLMQEKLMHFRQF